MPRKFDFASPGVELNEIDKSQIAAPTQEDGILLIGTSLKGPAMKPVKVRDLDSFIEIFGAPQSGKISSGTDVWRDGNRYGPTYAGYAAQAHLAAGISPVTFVRLVGQNNSLASSGDTLAGWNLGGNATDLGSPSSNTLAYGLFVMPSASAATGTTGSLAAVIYTKGASATLSGTIAGGSTTTSSVAQLIQSQGTGQGATFKMDIWSDASTSETYTFHFTSNNNSGFIRNVLNTNPQKLNTDSYSSTEKYFLGETYEEEIRRVLDAASATTAGKQYGILLPLVSGSAYWLDRKREATAPKSGWIVSREPDPTSAPSSWASSDAKKLFRIVSLHEGEWIQQNYAIKIHSLKLGSTVNPDSSFAITVVDAAGNSIENFYNLNLNESSENFILKKIGDEDRVWDDTNKVFNITGDYANQSNYIRIEMSDDWKAGLADDYALPWGFYGPSRIKGFSLAYGSSGVQAAGDVDNTGTFSNAEITLTAGDVTDEATIIFTAFDGTQYTIDFDSAVAIGSSSGSFDANNLAKVGVSGVAAAASASVGAKILTILQASPANGPGFVNSAETYDGADGSGYILGVSASTTGPAVFTITEAGDTGGDIAIGSVNAGTDTDNYGHAWVKGNGYTFGGGSNTDIFANLPVNMSCSFTFPSLRTTSANTKMNGNYNQTDVMGVRHVYGTTSTTNKVVYQSGDFADLLDALPAGLDVHGTTNSTETSFIFTLDEIKSGSNGLWYWEAGSLADGTSHAAVHGHTTYLKEAPKQFNVPLFGGFDGVDITMVNPFSSVKALDGATVKSHYAYNSVDKAIEIAADAESVKYDVVSMPGVTNSNLQNKLIRKVEERGDAMVIIDVNDGFVESFEGSGTKSGGDFASVITEAQSRDLNTSYAASYFPRIKLRDTLSGNNEVIVAPPSVAGIGAIAFSEANSDGPWFAPAGFNRGGIGILGGNSGPRVVGTWKTLSKANRDELYQENINPIARFPAVGEIVIFGQKTMQQTPSALDRINVRRLMIYLKKRIGTIADTLLFDQNVQTTWNRFLAQADPILSSVRARFGITDYKLILDNSTTTDDLIDRNIMYAKVFVKPARAIEYIVIDFIVTKTGVEF